MRFIDIDCMVVNGERDRVGFKDEDLVFVIVTSVEEGWLVSDTGLTRDGDLVKALACDGAGMRPK